ncbi:alpha/beta fold hydrolase [Maritimibacter sp. 55A14]|uniref:alpha/beta fold hydrolase n=1 Tax=Maritimibacter sp. 55A14 TaxID=2174844 RepID=UPI0026936353
MGVYTSSDGLRLAYRDEGEGQAVLCLPGLTRNSSDFDYMAAHISGVRLIRPDYRGRGASDWAPDHTSYTVPVEARDVVELLDHLDVPRAAIIGTSRGGLIGMMMAATAKDRMAGLLLNDVGPDIAPAGLERIREYVGRNPTAKTLDDAAEALARTMDGFADLPPGRWREEAARHFVQTENGLRINYDPVLRTAFLAAFEGDAPDLWPLFDALEGLPVGLIRGANSDLLAPETAAEMRRRRPDMIFAEVPDRGHIPFLDEAESLAAIGEFLEQTAWSTLR